ncbi:hypothetical protein JW979_03210 [bacterium]|nr:hypothetical protein [candidate division CSSED10-310 bacterium]
MNTVVNMVKSWLLGGIVFFFLTASWTGEIKASLAFSNIEFHLRPCDVESSDDDTYSLSFEITANASVPECYASVHLPAGVRHVSGMLTWSGSMAAGQTQVIEPVIQLEYQGRFSIKVELQTPMNPVTAIIRHVNIINESGYCRISEKPFIVMDLESATAPESRKKLLQLMAAETSCQWHAAGEMTYGNWAARISGKAEYYDIEGNLHPIRFAKVEIINEDPNAQYAGLGMGATDFDGNFAIDAYCNDADLIPDLRVRIHSRCPDGFFTGVCPSASDADYSLDSDLYTDCPPGTLTVNLKTGRPRMNDTTDDVAARVFSVLDAVLQASLEGYCIRLGEGNIIPAPAIDVHFPKPSCYNSTDDVLQIQWNDALDWDIIYHEFFHYFSRIAAHTDFNNGPGGTHDGSSNIPEYGKDKGIRLAWDEAIASFMAVAVQMEDRSNKELHIPCPAHSGLGNHVFENFEGDSFAWDMETMGQSSPLSEGYGSEVSVQSILYDMWDADVDGANQTGINCQDRLKLSLQTIWTLWNQGDFDDVSKFFGHINAMLIAADESTHSIVSDLFAINRVAPLASQPSHNALLSRFSIPTFTWLPQGDATPGYQNNHFILLIFKNGLMFHNIVFFKDGLNQPSYTLTKDEWQAVTAGSDNSTRYYWYVMGWNDQSPRTPPAAIGLGAFFSNVQSFALCPNIYAYGMMGCPNKEAALFFNGFPLEIDPSTNTYPFHGSSAGHDYDGDPIYFILDGWFNLATATVIVDIDMYADPGYTTHIRTDHAEATAWENWFYDSACDLTRDTSAGCRPIWFAVNFSESASGADFEAFNPPEFQLPECITTTFAR